MSRKLSPMKRLVNLARTLHEEFTNSGRGIHAGEYETCKSVVCENNRFALAEVEQELRRLRIRKRQEGRA